MQYLQYDLQVQGNQNIEVTLDHAANVLVLSKENLALYQARKKYDYYGGYVKVTPYVIRPPQPGHWYIVIDLGGNPGTVRAAVRVV